uniref:Uncharacterized protein n=1 Tax=Esox lucius TaxID=8010 RepID=A0AAY5KH08_ESOLU
MFVMGKDTDDAHRPSAQQSHKNKHAVCVDFFMSDALEKQQKQSGLFTAQHARAVVSYMECSKPPGIYSMRLLSSRHQATLAEALSDDSMDYTCSCINCPGQAGSLMWGSRRAGLLPRNSLTS